MGQEAISASWLYRDLIKSLAMTNTEIHAIIFDFDGTILETEVPDYRSWQEIYADYGGQLPLETWLQCVGGGVGLFDPYAYLEEQIGVELGSAGDPRKANSPLSRTRCGRTDPARHSGSTDRMSGQRPSPGRGLQLKPGLGRRLLG